MKPFWSKTIKISLICTALAVAALFAIDQDEPHGIPASKADVANDDVSIFYAQRYNFTILGLEKLHPFEGSKYRKIYDYLLAKNLISTDHTIIPDYPTQAQLESIHTQDYLRSLNNSEVLARIMEVKPLAWLPAPITDWFLLRSMRKATGGTIAACKAALQNKSKIAINIGGGYHHAAPDMGEGFCVYSDAPIAIKALQDLGLIRRALIVDTDAHQGNGFAKAALTLKNVYVLDYFEDAIFPHPKAPETWPIPLESEIDGKKYLRILRTSLPVAIKKFKPDFIFYNAGSDVLAVDPLSSMQLTTDDMVQRDAYVIDTAHSAGIPIAMGLAGGYSSESAMAHAKAIEKILTDRSRH